MRLRTADSVIFTESAKEWLAPEDEVVAFDSDGWIYDVIFEDEGVMVKSIPAEFLMHCGRA